MSSPTLRVLSVPEDGSMSSGSITPRSAASPRQVRFFVTAKKSKIFTREKLLLPAMMYCRFHEQQLFRKIERKFSSSSASFAVIKHLKYSSEKFHCRWSVARFAKRSSTSRAILLPNYLYFPLRTCGKRFLT
uniref:(northern house mosquito) hypothetical protein n=1 Tax=Culex pipiens TaxID=7175 RepID=A0A8D8ILU1_CULPI